MIVRTRNAPSPTGIPHIGNSRTALWDYLLAKKYKGQFILRLENTDSKRLVPEAEEKIYQIHDYLVLIPDEDPRKGGKFGPYIQTDRLDIYKKYAQELIDKKMAFEQEGAIRFKMPDDGYTTWKDLIQGKISIPNKEVDDKVLLKSDGVPTYHLASVIDDHLMEITHVIRGVEYISSAPLHFQMYKAFGWEPPIFLHAPLILGADRSKLSKRHGAKSVLDYKAEGYLPQAINNYLFYLGFSYKDNSDLLTLEEMVKIFDENRLQKQNAIFDQAKLDYFNSAWIKKLPIEDLLPFATDFVKKDYLEHKDFKKILDLVRQRLTTLAQIKDNLDYFFQAPAVNRKQILDQSEMGSQETSNWLIKAKDVLKSLQDFSLENIHNSLKLAQEKSGLSPRQAFMTLREVLTATPVTPPLFDIIEILGKKETQKRLETAINILPAESADLPDDNQST
jgi:glutamyl-tRNA synthetase